MSQMTAGLSPPKTTRSAVAATSKRETLGQLGAAFIALFLSAGLLKEISIVEALPIDLTVLATLMVAALGGYRFTQTRMSIPLASLMIPAFFVSTLPVFLWSSFGEYTILKAGSFVAFTLVVSFFAPILITTRHAMVSVQYWILLLALGMSIDSVLNRSGGGATGRLASLGNEISLGRTTGQAAILLIVLAIWKPKRLWLALPLASFLAIVMVGAGSRGPFLSLPLALVVVLLVSTKLNISVPVRAVMLAVVVSGAGFMTLRWAPTESVARLTDTSQLGASGRDALYEAGFDLLPNVPLGIGWGDWGERVDLFSGGTRLYPHNIFLEVGVELGWVPLAVLVAIIAYAFSSLLRERGTFEGELMLGIFMFVLLTAQVSGDLTDNRQLFVVLALSKHLESLPRRRPKPTQSHESPTVFFQPDFIERLAPVERGNKISESNESDVEPISRKSLFARHPDSGQARSQSNHDA